MNEQMLTRLLSRDEAKGLFDARGLDSGFPAPSGKDAIYVLHDGPARLAKLRLDHGESDWERAHAAESNRIVGFIVDGDLDVEGNVLNGEQDFGPALIVFGTLRARNVGLGGATVYVKNDLVASECLHGYYNHGVLCVGGDVHARVVVTSEYFGKIGGALAAPCFGSDHLEVTGGRTADVDIRTLLVPELLTTEDVGDKELEEGDDEPDVQIDHGEIFNRLESGTPVVIGGVVTEPCPLARAA